MSEAAVNIAAFRMRQAAIDVAQKYEAKGHDNAARAVRVVFADLYADELEELYNAIVRRECT